MTTSGATGRVIPVPRLPTASAFWPAFSFHVVIQYWQNQLEEERDFLAHSLQSTLVGKSHGRSLRERVTWHVASEKSGECMPVTAQLALSTHSTSPTHN